MHLRLWKTAAVSDAHDACKSILPHL